MSANQQAAVFITVPAGSDLSAKQYYFMDVTTGKLALAGAGTRVVGVLDNDPDAEDKPGTLQISGVARVLAGGTITSGAGVAAASTGKAEAATGSAFVVGISVSAATVSAGEYCEVLLTPSGAVGQAGDIETISAAGALNPGIATTLLSVTGTKAYTLADGTYVGQRKAIECTVAATTPLGTVTIDDAHTGESTVHVFTAVGQRLGLEWRSTGWKVVEKVRAGSQAVVVGTTVLTGFDMCATYALSVTGTVSSEDATEAIPDGQIAGEFIKINTPTAATIPLGDIAITAITIATNAAATSLAGINATSAQASFMWNGAAWQNLSLTTATLA